MSHSLICPSLFLLFNCLLDSLCVASSIWSFGLFVGFAIWSVVCCVLLFGLLVGVLLPLVGRSTFSLESLPLDTPATKWPSSYTLIQSHTTLSLSIPLYVAHSLSNGTTALAQFGLLVKLFPQAYSP